MSCRKKALKTKVIRIKQNLLFQNAQNEFCLKFNEKSKKEKVGIELSSYWNKEKTALRRNKSSISLESPWLSFSMPISPIRYHTILDGPCWYRFIVKSTPEGHDVVVSPLSEIFFN